ncbi:lipocalin-like domain-containing protein [Chryseobacterium daeguense]|uniref:lipocalin family protein n=1 Tax=Chryseobacterium daeguense TaxID=412438 RepID=UPI000417B05E|nr:lipocalin family protein [Chryseobacterium daeguense]
MKKLALLFAGLSLFVATGCSDDNDNNPMEYPLVGTWQPIKEVHTLVAVGETPISDEITYTDCEKEGRWVFTSSNGKRMEKGDSPTTPGQCDVTFDRNFTYTYDKDSKAIQIKYQGIVEPDKGKVTTLNETTLNLTIEDTSDPTEYTSVTYTMKRIPQ